MNTSSTSADRSPRHPGTGPASPPAHDVPAPSADNTASWHPPFATYGQAWRAVEIVSVAGPGAAIYGSLLGRLSTDVPVTAGNPLASCARHVRAQLADRVLEELGDRVRKVEIAAADATLAWDDVYRSGPISIEELAAFDAMRDAVDQVRLARAALARFGSDLPETLGVAS